MEGTLLRSAPTDARTSGNEPAPSRAAAKSPAGLYGKPLAFPRWRVHLARVVSILSFVIGVVYLRWRLTTLTGMGAVGIAFYVAEAANFLALTLAIVLFWRPRWRAGTPPPPAGTLDVFIPVCGEPASMVEETLQAALAISYPHRTYLLNDGRIAGKKNWQEIEELAERYGVTCFTRTTGAPGKGANLNHALARTSGEFLATIDADHRAVPGLAHETLGYFGQSDVGFVSTPQQFDGDRADFLNNREVLYFRYMAASKDAADSIQTYGNGVYRRAALESIGGFSEWVPLCEDLHSCYRMNALGWKGVYHPRALTTGLAPETASALAKQRLTWATDSLQIFFRDNPLLKRGLTLKQRLHYFQTTSHYLIACTQLLFALGPALWLLWRIPVMHPRSFQDYAAHTAPYFAAILLLLTLYGGVRGSIRVVQANSYLPPVYVLGLWRALTRKRRRATVTEKLRPSRFSLLLMPQVVLLALNLIGIGVALVRPVEARALVAAWAAWMIFALSGFLASVTQRRWVVRSLRVGLRAVVAAAVAVIFLLPPLAGGSSAGAGPAALPRWEGSPLTLVPPAQGAYLGVFNPDLLKSPSAVTEWNREHGVQARIVHWYQQWFGGWPGFRPDWLDQVARQGAVPMISWEPWAKPGGSVDQPQVRLAVIASGRYDRYIRSWARGARSYGRPVLLRPMQLMNGNWYPWAVGVNGNSDEDFVRAWRHIHDIFTGEGATNVSWVWAINSFAGMQGDNRNLAEFYPGDAYVDWVSMAGLNWGSSTTWGAWRTLDDLFGPTYAALSEFRKPVMISEIGTTASGGDAGSWVHQALTGLRERYPLVKAVVWFDSPSGPGVDFRVRGAEGDALRTEFLGAGSYWRQVPRIVTPSGGEASEPAASAGADPSRDR